MQKKVNSKVKRDRQTVSLCLNKMLYDSLEELRNNKIGNNTIIDDRSRTYEKILLLGLKAYQEQKEKEELISNLNVDLLKKLNLDELDINKINPDYLKKNTPT